MLSAEDKILRLVRRSKLFIPANREKFIQKAWNRGADCIILDLEDSIAPADKASARRVIKDAIPVVTRGGSEVEVRINREFAEEDLDAIMHPGLTSLMIPKCESALEIQRLDEMVAHFERERGIPTGSIQFDLIIETAVGIVSMEAIAPASPRIVQVSVGPVDLSGDMGWGHSPELRYDQFYYPSSRLLFAARAAGVQASGMAPQSKVDFTDLSPDREMMLQACRRSFEMGFLGSAVIHPAWCEPMNRGFNYTPAEIETARKIKAVMDEAYARGAGSASLDGRMVDVAHLKQVNRILVRAEAIARRDAEKAATMAAAGGM